MSTIKPHPSLPAPVVHAGFTASQSKSHVLAGVQDAYWSDDEGEDAECPLCLEEMDIADLNFKPCICGYQICRFCWHHIKENLNGRCPACRRVYTDESVQFKPIAKEDHKRLTQQKKQRERERKDLEALGRRHLANMRVVQRNVVYVVGIGPRFAKEELIPTLRSNEYFGQYGKITKIVLVKRTPAGGGDPVVGLYITYHRKEDAARCIAAVDGTAAPGGGRDIMRASYGTTKYCMAFLRSVSCSDHSCMNLHEWGEDKDCFTKEDLTTLKHTMKDTENRSRAVPRKKGEESEGLPRAAAWANKGSSSSASTAVHNNSNAFAHPSSSSTRTTRRGGGSRQPRSVASTVTDIRTGAKAHHDRKGGSGSVLSKVSSQASSSRSSTPAPLLPQKPSVPSEAKAPKLKEAPQIVQSRGSPTPSVTVESDGGLDQQDAASSSKRPQSVESTVQSTVQSTLQPVPSVPPGIMGPPPGLSAPPGIPPPSRLPRPETASPQTPILSSQSSYQMSSAARALLDDVTIRRNSTLPSTQISPFPDFDRTLQTLSVGDDAGFSFNLDPNLAPETANSDVAISDFESSTNVPFVGSFIDAFPALRSPSQAPGSSGLMPPPPGLAYGPSSNRSIYDPLAGRSGPPQLEQSIGDPNYLGSFDPFADNAEDVASSPRKSQPSLMDEERKVSRFGFARGRKGSTAASSPMHMSSPLSASDNYTSPFSSANAVPSPSSQWPTTVRLQQQASSDLTYSPSFAGMSSPSLTQAHAVPYSHEPIHFQPFETSISEAQLREFIQTSREQASTAPLQSTAIEPQLPPIKHVIGQPFNDPAIMSARLGSSSIPSDLPFMTASGAKNLPYPQLQYGPPPGLAFPSGMPPRPSVATDNDRAAFAEGLQSNRPTQVPALESSAPPSHLSSSDFPALSAQPLTQPSTRSFEGSPVEEIVTAQDDAALAKAQKKAEKQAKAAERAAERQKLALEKASARAAQKAKIVAEKAAEKERAIAIKAEQQKVAKEQLEKEKEEKTDIERFAKEKAAQVEREKAEKVAKVAEEKMKLKGSQQTPVIPGASAKVKHSINLAPEKPDRKTALPPGDNVAPASKVSSPSSVAQGPLLSKMPKKSKPIITKAIKVPSKDECAEESSTHPSTPVPDVPVLSVDKTRGPSTGQSSSNNSRAESMERHPGNDPTSLADLLEDIDIQHPYMDLASHPFFDLTKMNASAKMPLEYGPLVHALSALNLSVAGGSFANNMPSGSIDNAVSSFQQLLETLTQTISDLLRLLPRTTWDDSSSFDGVLRDMLKGDDFLDDGGEEAPGREDEVAALTLALERRARWMEVQLSKLEELHRDINTAAVRAVLSFNDSGWDRPGFLPRIGNTLRRFSNIGLIENKGVTRVMTANELEEKLVVAKEAAIFAEADLWEVMEKMQQYKPLDVETL